MRSERKIPYKYLKIDPRNVLRSKFNLELPYPFQANAISRVREKLGSNGILRDSLFVKGKLKGKVHTRTGHEGPEGE